MSALTATAIVADPSWRVPSGWTAGTSAASIAPTAELVDAWHRLVEEVIVKV
jgi:hypothetical protein